jgi:hypothetical protein
MYQRNPHPFFITFSYKPSFKFIYGSIRFELFLKDPFAPNRFTPYIWSRGLHSIGDDESTRMLAAAVDGIKANTYCLGFRQRGKI